MGIPSSNSTSTAHNCNNPSILRKCKKHNNRKKPRPIFQDNPGLARTIEWKENTL